MGFKGLIYEQKDFIVMMDKLTKKDEKNSLKEVVFVFNHRNKLLRWNNFLCEFTGFCEDEIAKMAAIDIFSRKDVESVKKAVETAYERGYDSLEAKMIAAGDKSIPFHFTFALLKGKEVGGAEICAVGRVIREPSVAGNANHVREKHYHQLFNGMLDGFSLWEILCDDKRKPCDFRLMDLNPSFEKLAGLGKTKLTGKRAGEVIHGLRPVLLSVYEKAVATSKTVRTVYYSAEFDKYFKVTAYCSCENQIVAIFTDITEKQKAKEEKKRLQSQLFQAQKMEAIGRLAGGVAHDFNNLLTAIQGYTELAMMQTKDEFALLESLKQIHMATERATKLASQLMIFSRKERVSMYPHNLNEIINNLVDMLRRMIGEHITVHVELEPELLMTRVNRGQIEQVLMNLAVNARDAMPGGGRLTIKTENVEIEDQYMRSNSFARPGSFVCLSVKDTGIGMDQKTVARVFEPFFTTKRSGEGTGLGLAVVYGIVEEHQGWINVYSEPGMGSVFKIYLPYCAEKTVSKKDSTIYSQKVEGSGEKILFVEDDTALCNFMKAQLARWGYTVITAENVEQAVAIYEEEKDGFDILFTDMVLPDKSGIELIETLHARNPSLKVILTSGYLYEKSELPLFKDVDVIFIQKPYTLFTLLQTIRQSMDVMI